MKYILFCISTLILSVQLMFSQDFNFDKSLRIDFQLSGDNNSTQFFLTQLKAEPHYGGSTTNLIMPKYGDFRLELLDLKTGEILFGKGFNSLYSEWLHSRKPNEHKLFYHAVQMPFPLRDMLMKISQRQTNGEFKSIHTDTISPNNYFIKSESVTPYTVRQIVNNGDAAHKVDIAVIAEGYTEAEMEKFYGDVKRLSDYMFTVPPFDTFKKDFNIYAIGSVSMESGVDVPGRHIYRNTVANSSFYTFDMERYLTSDDIGTIADIASLVPYDQIYVMVNTELYGGAGFYNHINLTAANHKLSPQVFVHEFGHGFAGLADEYYTSETSFDSMYLSGSEPWEANITTLVNFGSKWLSMIDKKTPIPTPRTEKYRDKVGVFEGGGYSAKGVYSPMQECRMKNNTTDSFCPVCQKAIQNVIEFYTR